MLLRAITITTPLCIRCLTHYEVLSITRTATKADIKQAYLDKAKECHPDLNPDNVKAAIQFQELQDAHDTLMDSKQRAQYNQQINQESYFGSQQTQRPTNEPRKSNVRSHGVNNQYSTGGNEKFHENHRVNQDNYKSPGSQKKYNIHPNQNDLPDKMSSQMQGGSYVLGLAFLSVLIYGVVKTVFGIKEGMQDGRHGILKLAENLNADTKSTVKSSAGFSGNGRDAKSSVEPRRYVYNADQDATIRDLPKSQNTRGKPEQDVIRYVWSEEKGKLVRMYTLKNHVGAGAAGLKEKFDATIQTKLGEIRVEEENESDPEVRKAITLNDIRFLKREMSKKKSDYLTAKSEYSETLQLYKVELKEKRENNKEKDVV